MHTTTNHHIDMIMNIEDDISNTKNPNIYNVIVILIWLSVDWKVQDCDLIMFLVA